MTRPPVFAAVSEKALMQLKIDNSPIPMSALCVLFQFKCVRNLGATLGGKYLHLLYQFVTLY